MFEAIIDLQAHATRAAEPRALADVLDRALLALSDLLPYDLAAILELHGTHLSVRAARGRLADARVRDHRLDLAAYPTIRRALELRRPIALTHDHHTSAEGDPYDGVLDLPEGHACMVVPLFAGDRDLGVITLDRDVCVPYDAHAVHLAGVVGQVVALAIMCAEQARAADAQRRDAHAQTRLLLAQTDAGADFERHLRSTNPAMQRAVRMARQVAATDTPVMLLGARGVGKRLLAHAIHAWSPRKQAPLITVRCAAIASTEIEGVLFGSPDDPSAALGRLRLARGGTLLLQDIDRLPLPAQDRLLQWLSLTPTAVRIVTSSAVDVPKAVARGQFRAALHAQFDLFSLHVPRLAARLVDLPQIASSILHEMATRTGRGPWALPQDTLADLLAQPWPGNVHQLRNALQRATILRPCGALRPEDFALPRQSDRASNSLEPLDAVMRAHISAVLRQTEGRVYGAHGAARILGLKPSTLQSRMKKLGIDRRAAARSPQGDAP